MKTMEIHTLTTIFLLLFIRLDKSAAILKGKETSIEKYPYLIQIYQDDSFICGGFLVTPQHAVTAAHCFYNSTTAEWYDIRRFAIKSGTSTLEDGTIHSISSVWKRKYNHCKKRNDIAIVVLSTEVNIRHEDLAKLPPPGYTVPDEDLLTALGWGVTNPYTSTPSNVLREARIPNVDLNTCKRKYKRYVLSNVICAGWLGKMDEDTCIGDSGGPVINNGMVVAVISWGKGCGSPKYPGINTRLIDYIPWIMETINKTRIHYAKNQYNTAYRASGSVLIVFITTFYCFYDIIFKYL